MSQVSQYQAHQQSGGCLLNANENVLNLDDQIRKEILGKIQEVSFNRYPDETSQALGHKWARLKDLDAGQVIVGNGSDQLLQLVITAFCSSARPLVTIAPDFGMYDFYASCKETPVYKLSCAWDGQFAIEELAALAKEKNAGLVLFSNPNNPTGHMVQASEICRLARLLDPIPLFVDEAYMDFGKDSILPYLGEHPNLLITHTLSKAWGAAGIRIGFLMGNEEMIQQLLPWKVVYSVSALDEIAALCVLDHTDQPEEYVRQINEQKAEMMKALEQISSLEIAPSAANFISIRPVDPSKMSSLEEAFDRAGLVIRTYPSKERIRITIGLENENQKVMELLKTWSAQEENK